MLAKLPSAAPNIDPARLLATGATELRQAFTPDELSGVLIAYMHGLKGAFALSIGFCGLAFLSTLFIPWSKLPTHIEEKSEVDV